MKKIRTLTSLVLMYGVKILFNLATYILPKGEWISLTMNNVKVESIEKDKNLIKLPASKSFIERSIIERSIIEGIQIELQEFKDRIRNKD